MLEIMSIENIGNLGDFIGAMCSVVATIYLAYQVKQSTKQIDHNTRAVRSQGLNSSISHTLTIRQAIFEDKEIIRVFNIGNADIQQLNEAERLRYRLVMHNCIGTIWNTYTQVRYADLPKDIWDSQTTLIKRLLLSDGGIWFWTHFNGEFDTLFKEDVNKILFPDGNILISQIPII
jgi:hypothetical protein